MSAQRFAEAYRYWLDVQAAMDLLETSDDGDTKKWSQLFDAERDAVWTMIRAPTTDIDQIRQLAVVLVQECKTGAAADGRLVALAEALLDDLGGLST
jgi:hypothetical protein